MIDPNLKLELSLTPGTIFQGNGGVEKWVSPIGGHCFTQDTVAAKPKLQADGLYFDGGDWLLADYIPAFRTFNFFISFWVKFSSVAGNSVIISQKSISAKFFSIRRYSTGLFFTSSNGQFSASHSWIADTWYHVAFGRNGATPLIFVDGVLKTITIDVALGDFNGTGGLQVGAEYDYTSYFVAGELTDIRIYDVAKYTANFTPPPRSQLAMPASAIQPLSAPSLSALGNSFQFGS